MALPTSPSRLQQRAGFWSVPIIATRVGLICTTRSSGTVPPDEAHSPQKKDTRKYEQQAPQLRHGLASDMGVIDKKSRMWVLRKARHSIRAMAVGKGGANLYFRRESPVAAGEIMPYQLYESLQTSVPGLIMLQVPGRMHRASQLS